MTESKPSLKEILIRFTLFSLLWGILVGSDLDGWLYGILVISLATYISLTLVPKATWVFRPISMLHFSTFFVWHALRGGIDVITRAFHPHLPIEPGFFHHEFRLPPGSARVLLAFVTSLLPGTLSSVLKDDQLIIHVLDINQPIKQQLHNLEGQVANLYGIKHLSKG